MNNTFDFSAFSKVLPTTAKPTITCVKAVYQRIQGNAETAEGVSGNLFRSLLKSHGEQGMKDLIKYVTDCKLSGRVIDKVLSKCKLEELTHKYTATTSLVGKACDDGTVQIDVGEQLAIMSAEFGRHRFDAFKRGTLYKWQTHTDLSPAQLNLFAWLRKLDLLPFIVANGVSDVRLISRKRTVDQAEPADPKKHRR